MRALQPCSQLGMSRGAAEALQLCSSPGRPRHLQSTGGTTATSCPSPGRTSTSWPPGRTWPGMRTRSCRCVPGSLGRLAPGAAHHSLWGLWPHWHAQGRASPPHRGRLPWTAALASPLQPVPLSAAGSGGRCGPGVETVFRRGRPAPGVTYAGGRGRPCVPAGPAPALESRRRAGAPGLLPAGVPAALRPLHHQAGSVAPALAPALRDLGKGVRPASPLAPLTAVPPNCRLWDGGGPAEPGCVLPSPGAGRAEAAGGPGPAAGAQTGQCRGWAGGSLLPAPRSCLHGNAWATVSLRTCPPPGPAPIPGHRSPGTQTQGPPGESIATHPHTAQGQPSSAPAPRILSTTLGVKMWAPELTGGRVTPALRP